jgi:hypothetical protein
MVKSKLATQTNGITRQRMGSFRKHSNHIGHHRTANSKSMDHPPLSDPSPPRSNKVTSTSTVTNPHVLAKPMYPHHSRAFPTLRKHHFDVFPFTNPPLSNPLSSPIFLPLSENKGQLVLSSSLYLYMKMSFYSADRISQFLCLFVYV